MPHTSLQREGAHISFFPYVPYYCLNENVIPNSKDGRELILFTQSFGISLGISIRLMALRMALGKLLRTG